MQVPSLRKTLKSAAYAFGLLITACVLSSCDSIVSLLTFLIELPIDVIETVLPTL